MMKIYTYAATGAIIPSFLKLEIEGDEYLAQAPVNSRTLFVEEEFLFQVWSGGKCNEKNPSSIIIHFTFQVIPSKVPNLLQFNILYGSRLE
jgi:hypothetical protein